MKTKTLFTRYLLALIVVLLVGPLAAHAQDAKQILERLEAKYQATDALRADFKQTTTSPFSDQASTFRGTLLLQGDRYRVETDRQTLVTNGTTTWIYTPAERQVIVSKNVKNETAFVPSEFFYDYRDRFTVRSSRVVEQDGSTYHVLRMRPKKEHSFYRSITLWVRDRDALITRLEVVDANDTQMVFDLRDVEFVPSLSVDAFTFSPPQSAEVIDLRS